MNKNSSRHFVSKQNASSLQQLARAVYYSNCLVGLITACASLFTIGLQQVDFDLKCFTFIFASTVFVYNFDRKSPSAIDLRNNPLRTRWLFEQRTFINSVNIICFLLCCWSFFTTVTLTKAIVILSLFLICLVYCLSRKYKKVPGLKNFTIASVWSCSVTVLPAVWLKLEINWQLLILNFFMAFINSLIFDLRDTEGDRRNDINSLAVLLEKSKCFILIDTLCVILLISSLNHLYFSGFALCAIIFSLHKKNIQSISRETLLEMVLIIPVLIALFL